jgi:hypothetical protein
MNVSFRELAWEGVDNDNKTEARFDAAKDPTDFPPWVSSFTEKAYLYSQKDAENTQDGDHSKCEKTYLRTSKHSLEQQEGDRCHKNHRLQECFFLHCSFQIYEGSDKDFFSKVLSP